MSRSYVLIIVDDFDMSVLDLRHTLDATSYITELVLCERINVDNIVQAKPDIILAQFNLPNVSSMGTLLDIRANERLKDIPVIVLAAFDDVAHNLSPHVDAVLLKPVNLEWLAGLLTMPGSIKKNVDETPWDALTGLYNSSFFTARLNQVLEHTRQVNGSQFIVYSVNLVKSEHFEERFEKEFEERILQGAAKVLKKNLRSRDIVSRFEADQFLVLIETTIDFFEPTSIAERIQIKLDDYLVSTGFNNHIRVDIGGVCCTANYVTVDEVLHDLQFARHTAKNEKHNSFKIYSRNMSPIKTEGIKTLAGV